jgi:hypothetical protein
VMVHYERSSGRWDRLAVPIELSRHKPGAASLSPRRHVRLMPILVNGYQLPVAGSNPVTTRLLFPQSSLVLGIDSKWPNSGSVPFSRSRKTCVHSRKFESVAQFEFFPCNSF